MKRSLILALACLLLAAPAMPLTPCTIDGGCGDPNTCGPTSYAASNSLFADWSELSYQRAYCSRSGETISESYEVYCDSSPSEPCQAKDYADAAGFAYDLYYAYP